MTHGKIGLQMFNLKNKIAEIGIYETFRKIKDLGFSYVEISNIEMSNDNVTELRRASSAFGITIVSVSALLETFPGVPGESLTQDFDKIVNDCKQLGCNTIRIGMMPFHLIGHKDKIIAYIQEAETIAEQLAAHGIELHYHNHHIEFEKYDGKYLLEIMLNSTSKLGFELDVHWVQRGGENPIEIIKRFAGRISLLHLKDFRVGRIQAVEEDFKDISKFMYKFNNNIEFAELGLGNLDIKGIMETGLASGVKYFLVEQDDTYGKDPFDCLETSARYLRQLGYAELF
ncbi:sugar phosphate isomerase/epimerase family protein [Paenibacillus antibioticophila]|uniref:sugar phosphate isomerase/epimerase family protein n=1 Tax=Paenibacillus antibioticophila TaxID=1274374 RepID=UPI0005C8BEFF|nr:sugar phosphate isomerase/epimerase [Paenibacillus antibioticophila]